MKFKIHVERFMERDGLTITAISKGTGISRPTLTRYTKTSLQKVESRNIQALCKFFRCQPGDIVEFVEEDMKAGA